MLKANVDEEKDAIAFGVFTMITVNPTGIDKVRCAVRTVNVTINQSICLVNFTFGCQMIAQILTKYGHSVTCKQ